MLAEIDREAERLDPGHVRRVTESAGVLSPADVRPYVTRSAHGTWPAGTECRVSRPGDGSMLRLEFPNGEVTWTHGYAAGIEWRLEQATAEYAERVAAEEGMHPDG